MGSPRPDAHSQAFLSERSGVGDLGGDALAKATAVRVVFPGSSPQYQDRRGRSVSSGVAPTCARSDRYGVGSELDPSRENGEDAAVQAQEGRGGMVAGLCSRIESRRVRMGAIEKEVGERSPGRGGRVEHHGPSESVGNLFVPKVAPLLPSCFDSL